ncbi:hypothetical protein HYPSUDRAFT_40941 [Hypholoma sublateritium FD-334 SS-4]|uniref:Uncharacterized protein n=1 Tax=Hypholoma sublateritium (strain FD-334 SS-4) TaxID=945553 RepID=A0A0D2MG13_HYPSF|nr:hypothetical protein HYPSUDRAFT_40941 [Hypholoma sublateritium FD-334 SS-4]
MSLSNPEEGRRDDILIPPVDCAPLPVPYPPPSPLTASESTLLASMRTPRLPLPDPHCHGMSELPDTARLRARVSAILQQRRGESRISSSNAMTDADADAGAEPVDENSALFVHLAHGLACTAGSALGSAPPPADACLAAYCTPNRVGLTAGARAWSKHCHRSDVPATGDAAADARSAGWWGRAKGPVAAINAGALALFWRVVRGATWRNLHWLPHAVLVYEVRVPAGYGMRWAQDQASAAAAGGVGDDAPWVFRGFLEPPMEGGHEVGWRHPVCVAD